MDFSRVFVLLSITLCLVACLCAYASVTQVQAKRKVTDIQEQTMQTLLKAQKKYNDAMFAKRTVELRKAKAENAASEAAATAKGNEEAKEFVEKAKSEWNAFSQLYSDAQNKAAAAVSAMEKIKSEATMLNNEAESKVSPNTASSGDSVQPGDRLTTLKAKHNILETNINAQQSLLDSANAAIASLEDHASKAQVAKDQAEAIVTVAKMQTLLTEADAEILLIEKKREKVNAIVNEIGVIFDNAPGELLIQIVGSRDNAEGYLKEISRSVREVKEDKNTMFGYKQNADGFLANIKTATEESEVQAHLRGITTSAGQAAESLKKIKGTVISADAQVRNVNYRKQDMLDVLSVKKSKPAGKDTTEPNDQQHGITEVGAMTKPTSEDTTEQTKTNPGQPLQKAATKPMTLGTSGQSIATPSQPVQGAETKPTSEDTTGKNDTNTSEHFQDVTTKPTSEDTKEEKETKAGQYATKPANSTGTKGIVFPYDTINDGAITASFSVLLALIACAVLN